MALSIIKVANWKKKWEGKLQSTTESYLKKTEKGKKWSLVALSFTVVCREALESVVFMAGIGVNKPATSLPIPIILGILSGFFVGWVILRGSHKISLNIFLITTTTFMLFIAAGLFSTAIDEFQDATNNSGTVLWTLNCCDPDTETFWETMHGLFGWDNKSTVGTFCGYFSYWIVVICAIIFIYRRGEKDAKEVKVDDLESNEKSASEVADKE
ncbi:5716_t:CDS:2 [Acaulospora colombiana]|uniref:5716_t:CDS:1 n=1 Tax=Acaulospora colombiana TaxID=27376 RepID=A0ACA9NLF1_9GLOM|nr:5716_t:CDS:2 [Acaulospora colombiana]